MKRLRRRVTTVISVVCAIIVAALGVSYATALATGAASSTVIHGCYLNKIGTLRVVDPTTQHCLPVETPIQWNQSGPSGPPGPPGPKGDPGSVSSIDALNGIPCGHLGRAGQTAFLGSSSIVDQFDMRMVCLTPDSSEPNNTRATEASFEYNGDRTLYPAGDEDWYVLSLPAHPMSIVVWQSGIEDTLGAPATPIHIEIYDGGSLAASGDGTVNYFPSGGGPFEIHVTGSQAALYNIGAF
jgi:hypothetical protein